MEPKFHPVVQEFVDAMNRVYDLLKELQEARKAEEAARVKWQEARNRGEI